MSNIKKNEGGILAISTGSPFYSEYYNALLRIGEITHKELYRQILEHYENKDKKISVMFDNEASLSERLPRKHHGVWDANDIGSLFLNIRLKHGEYIVESDASFTSKALFDIVDLSEEFDAAIIPGTFIASLEGILRTVSPVIDNGKIKDILCKTSGSDTNVYDDEKIIHPLRDFEKQKNSISISDKKIITYICGELNDFSNFIHETNEKYSVILNPSSHGLFYEDMEDIYLYGGFRIRERGIYRNLLNAKTHSKETILMVSDAFANVINAFKIKDIEFEFGEYCYPSEEEKYIGERAYIKNTPCLFLDYELISVV